MDEQIDQNTNKDECVLVVRFADVNSTVFQIQAMNVNPLQLLMISAYLEFLSKNGLAQEAQAQIQKRIAQEQMSKIITPEDIRKSQSL